MTGALVCWHCGASLAGELLPFARVAECPGCRTDLHVCRQCVYYDTGKAKHCQEPIAEEVRDKTRANFCDYFAPACNAYRPDDPSALAAARAGLDALFGDAAASAAAASSDDAAAALNRLFGRDDN